MSAPLSDHDLEAALREMLRRRALDVNPEPPAWRELAQRTDAVVISLHTGAPVDPEARRKRRGPGRQWFRPVLAAAVALVVAMVGALVVRGSGPDSGDAADGPEAIDVPPAGQPEFDPARATPLFPVTDDASPDIAVYDYLSDPTATAEEYLAMVGLPGRSLVVDPAAPPSSINSGDGEPPIKTTTVAWSIRAEGLPENPALAEGTVWLRNPERGGRDTWLVVGVSTRMLWLTDIRREGDTLSFTVDRSTDVETFPEEATVTVNSELVGGVGIGEVRLFTVGHAAGEVAIVQVQQREDGVPISITATAVPALPGGSMAVPDSRVAPATTAVRGADPTDGPTVLAPSVAEATPAAVEARRKLVVSRR